MAGVGAAPLWGSADPVDRAEVTDVDWGSLDWGSLPAGRAGGSTWPFSSGVDQLGGSRVHVPRRWAFPASFLREVGDLTPPTTSIATAIDFRARCWSHHQSAIEAASPSGGSGDLLPFKLITTSGSRALRSDTAGAAVVVAGAVLPLVGPRYAGGLKRRARPRRRLGASCNRQE
jgi:hypothetical protein